MSESLKWTFPALKPGITHRELVAALNLRLSRLERILQQRYVQDFKYRGTDTQSGDGATTVFTTAHGMSVTPTLVMVEPSSAHANVRRHLTVDGTNITITFASAPNSGTDNLTWFWAVG